MPPLELDETEHGFFGRILIFPTSFFVDGLGQNDILFIDTTHMVKSGGDCIYTLKTRKPWKI
jgi:hypothetical protein